MVSYISKLTVKSLPRFGKINSSNLISYTPNLAFWGGASTFGLFVFTEGIPLFQNAFYKNIPFLGEYWVHSFDPQDLPQ